MLQIVVSLMIITYDGNSFIIQATVANPINKTLH